MREIDQAQKSTLSLKSSASRARVNNNFDLEIGDIEPQIFSQKPESKRPYLPLASSKKNSQANISREIADFNTIDYKTSPTCAIFS